jgi:hypothetical protein
MKSRRRATAARVGARSNNLTKQKKTVRAAIKSTTTAIKSTTQVGELVLAAGRVVARRSTLGAAAMLDPANADCAEFSRMMPEKIAAFSASGMALYRWASDVAYQVARTMGDEAANIARASTELALCRTPAAAVAVQTKFAIGWCERALSQLLTGSALAMRSHGTMLTPLHRAATRNDRRLAL